MILLTGGAGFIGSALLGRLNQNGRRDIILVDSLGSDEKWKNIANKHIEDYCDKNKFLQMLEQGHTLEGVDCVYHLGACSSTTESRIDYLMDNNFRFSKLLAEAAMKKKIPFIYASSAATYGDGSFGFDDDPSQLDSLLPLNGYALSKHLFDKWIITKKTDSQVLGLKFFNVFGPNEYHKGSMRSVVYKAFYEIIEKKYLSLFKSDHPDYADGEQKRDFIYVKDVIATILECQEKSISGLYNLGSGAAKSWNELAHAAFSALSIQPSIEYIPLPIHLKGKYQYYTCANMSALKMQKLTHTFTNLTDAVSDYYTHYLKQPNPYL
jgi:ADP-L-glycero-D-manno-heptose 6-epimerase